VATGGNGGTASPDAGKDLAGGSDLADASDLARGPDVRLSADLASPDPLRQLGPLTNGTNAVSPTLLTASRAGTLLVFSVVFDRAARPSLPIEWRSAGYGYSSDPVVAGLWYQPDNPGGVTTATASLVGATVSVAQLSEWDTASTWDAANYCYTSLATSLTCSTASGPYPQTSHPQEFALGCFGEVLSTARAVTTSPSNGFKVLGQNDSAVSKLHYSFSYWPNVPINSQIIETVSSTVTGGWAGDVCSFY
jgi:hypothetical protein